jgi:5-methylcytosine-specific restriction enzyme subunit McrC
MSNTKTVFEHQSLKVDKPLLEALQKFRGDKKDFPYYSLIHNGIKFNSYVGVIQVGKTIIEVLPKSDKSESNENRWRKILIGMLRTVYNFEIKAPTQSSLKIKANSILELYFEMFVKEVEYLLHTGLSKQYRKIEGNLNTLKGKILFQKNIQKNLVHKERFFVNYTTYDKEHILHKILYKTLKLLQNINTNPLLQSRICALLLDFPEMPDIKATENLFNRIVYSRKTKAYKKAIDIAKMLLLNYHPDIQGGSNSVLALMFDMNVLWEKFVYKSLKKEQNKGFEVKEQVSKPFWNNDSRSKTIRPDIVIKDKENKENCIVLDTKWKVLGDEAKDVSDSDLKQMFVYSIYFKAQKVALVYPSNSENKDAKGKFKEILNETKNRICDLVFISANEDIKAWQKEINDAILQIL